MDDAGSDPLLVRPEAELDVGRRRHRVAGDEEGHGPVAGGFQDLPTLLEVLPGKDVDRLPDHHAEGLQGRAPEARRVELREHGVRGPRGLEPLHGDVLLVEEAEPDEDEFPHGGHLIRDRHK